MNLSEIIERLHRTGRLTDDEFGALLSPDLDVEAAHQLATAARAVTDCVHGRRVRVRGLIEITSVCRNNCLYCGLRRDNRSAVRYTLSHEQIVEACREGYDAGLRTFVLQGGENPAITCAKVVRLVSDIVRACPDAAVTLSLGEWPDEALEAFRSAGATRYLLRHETYDARHYSSLHPREMSQDNRLRCLDTLKRLGFQTGTGIMVGSPGQTIDNIVSDLRYMHTLQPQMIGIGPFIPAAGTPFENCLPGNIDLTLRLISILRLMFPSANFPSTTALATLDPEGRIKGLLAGANVVMPNITPAPFRGAYTIYDNKKVTGAEAGDGLRLLADELAGAGLEMTCERGDYKNISLTCTTPILQ